jgi:lipopolysaccharide/colanic/teichoic acid biosynthesis glycosyltransferase
VNFLTRAADFFLILLGALLVANLRTSAIGRPSTLAVEHIAFVTALSLSVFPSLGCYRRLENSSVWSTCARLVAAWLIVQAADLALILFLSDIEVPFQQTLLWTLFSLAGMIGIRVLGRCAILMRSRSNLANDVSTNGATEACRMQRVLKRSFDMVASVILLMFLSPVFALIAIIVRRDGGSIIFGHKRIGRGGESFRCLKFRTMMPNADVVLQRLLESDSAAREMWEREFKLKNDIRVTPIGRILRASSLDELPQLWNVLRGEMSLVGPRPIIERELQKYGDFASVYLSAVPGMTGLWQVSGRNDVDYETRVRLDTAYVKNWSLMEDFRILFKTLSVVAKRVGAY